MPYQLVKTRECESWIKLSGTLTVADFQAVQQLAASSMEHFAQLRVLVELEGFQGWSKEAAWADTFILSDDQASDSKLAFVGDGKWRDEVFMFTGKGMRMTSIEFFTQDQKELAKAWLAEDKAQSLFLD